MGTYRWGIAGCGTVANFHAMAIGELEGAELAACADLDGDKAAEFAHKYGIRRWYDSLDKMFARESLDICSICTPSGTHYTTALLAIEHGIHTLVEKPIATTLEEIDELGEAAERNGVQLGGVLQSRFGQAEQTLKKLVDENVFGEVVLGEADVRWYRSETYYRSAHWRGTRAHADGALMNQGIHTIDLLQWYLGRVKRLFGRVKTLIHKIEMEDIAVAGLEFESGALGVVKGSTCISPGFPKRVGIYGSKMSAELLGGKIVVYDSTRVGEKIAAEDKGDPSADPLALDYQNHRRQLADFLDAVRKGRPPMVDVKEARKSVEIVLGIYKASKEGTVVELPLR